MEVKDRGPVQTYETPPLPLTVRLWELHTGELLLRVGMGTGFKMMLALAAAVQPRADPKTEYSVVTPGDSEMVALVALVFQT